MIDYKAEPFTDANVWISINTTTCNNSIKTLSKGVNYIFRVGAIGSRGQVTYSDTTTRVAQ
ncbi:MAG: hypothetical protein ABIN01_16330 [Ferruginibacter sp.]